VATKKSKKVETSSSSSSSSDSSSEDEKKPVAKVVAKAPVSAPTSAAKKAAPAKKESSSSSSSSSDSSDSEDEKPAAKKPIAKKKSSSSSSSSSSDSDSDDEKPAAKRQAVAAPKKTAAKKDASSDSDSDSEDEKPVAKPVVKKAAAPSSSALKVETDAPQSSGASTLANKIFVKGLPWVVSEEEIRDYFKACGKMVKVELPVQADGRASGTAYVEFSKRAEVDAALKLDGGIWPGTERWLKIEEAREKPNKPMGSGGIRPEGCDTVFIGNLPWDVTEEQLREIFGSCGDINQVRFAMGEDGSFRGFGHVQFTSGDSTDAAVQLAGSDVNGRPIRVDYAPPRERKERASFGSPGAGRGRGEGRGRGDGRGRGGEGRGRGGRDSGRGGGVVNKNKGAIVGGATGKKMTFDE